MRGGPGAAARAAALDHLARENAARGELGAAARATAQGSSIEKHGARELCAVQTGEVAMLAWKVK